VSAKTRAARLRVTTASGDQIVVPRVPKHIVEKYGSGREWKATKRQQLAAASAAVGELRIGAAFFPRPDGKGYASELDAAEKALARLTTLLSVKVWGR
jgi:hypothetical protein